jgi:hypothetical protein
MKSDTPAAETTDSDRHWRRRAVAQRAKIITLANIYHGIAPDMADDAASLAEPVPNYAPEKYVSALRWFAQRVLVFVELERRLGAGNVTRGHHLDGMAIVDAVGGKPSEAARRVAENDLGEWRRDPVDLYLIVADDEGDA